MMEDDYNYDYAPSGIFEKGDVVAVNLIKERSSSGVWLVSPPDWAVSTSYIVRRRFMKVMWSSNSDCLLMKLNHNIDLEEMSAMMDEETAFRYDISEDFIGEPYIYTACSNVERAREGCWCRGPHCPNGYNVYMVPDRTDGTYLCRSCKEHLRSLGKDDVEWQPAR